MSLVNDLLIELDRQNDEAPSAFLDGLEPRRESPAQARRRKLVPIAIGLTTLSVILLGLAVAVQMAFGPQADHEPPAVSARAVGLERPDDLAITTTPLEEETRAALAESPAVTPSTASTATSTTTRVDRPPVVEGITLAREEGYTRLRIDAGGELLHSIDHDLANRRLELYLEGASLAAPLTPLDLRGTPIRSISTSTEPGGIRLVVGLDEGVRIQSQSAESTDGTTLFLDLQSPEAPTVTPSPKIATKSAAKTRPAESESAVSTEAIRVPTPKEQGVAAVKPASSPSEMGITRSATDRLRIDRDRARSRAAEEIAAARIARAEGDLEEADRRYANAIDHQPDHRDALLEWASLLAETERTNEAIDLMRVARRSAPKDAGLAMLHARLLERADRIEEAIQLLERGSFSLTEAPDVHALMAAYLQRAGLHDQAIERYEKIVRQYPGEARWWMGLGISLEARERLEEAVDVYRIAIQIGELSSPTRRWVAARIEELGEEG